MRSAQNKSGIPTQRRLEYASGYLELHLPKEALAELEAIAKSDQRQPEVIQLRVQVYMQLRQWLRVVTVARQLAGLSPDDENGWICWAYALRELNRIKEAQSVLLKAEPLHGKTCGVLHYNLACYACLLENFSEAKRRLILAFRMSKEWRASALTDLDLKSLWTEIADLR